MGSSGMWARAHSMGRSGGVVREMRYSGVCKCYKGRQHREKAEGSISDKTAFRETVT